MAISDDLNDLIASEMPSDATVERHTELGGQTFTIHRKLLDDPNRPNKPARIIAVHMALESESQRAQSYDAIRTFIRAELIGFDWTHDQPKWTPAPVERWVVFGQNP